MYTATAQVGSYSNLLTVSLIIVFQSVLPDAHVSLTSNAVEDTPRWEQAIEAHFRL
jgi:hypothetical protein